MIFIDTHTHLYLPEFDSDRKQVMNKAVESGVKYFIVPNVDSETLNPMLSFCSSYPGISFPALGLHPVSVKDNFKDGLEIIHKALQETDCKAIGEIGLDLYWDKTFFKQQVMALRQQFDWAVQKDLPVLLHSRNSLPELLQLVEEYRNTGLRGVFHCFPGNYEQAKKIIRILDTK